MPNPGNPADLIRIAMVRPLAFIQGAVASDQVWLQLEEVGLAGWATIDSIGEAPTEEKGEGCLVTMTMEHVASEVLLLRFVGTDETLELTPLHPPYVEGVGWVRAGDLVPGMELRATAGNVFVESVEASAPNQVVYNVEVSTEHSYRVGDRGVWAHNTCAKPPGGSGGSGPPKVGNVPKPPRGKGSVPKADRDPKRGFSREQTEKAIERQGGCAGCGEPLPIEEADGHHVQRHADGGPTTDDNLAAVCKGCHKEIHAKD